jgi:hypothetical protein
MKDQTEQSENDGASDSKVDAAEAASPKTAPAARVTPVFDVVA